MRSTTSLRRTALALLTTLNVIALPVEAVATERPPEVTSTAQLQSPYPWAVTISGRDYADLSFTCGPQGHRICAPNSDDAVTDPPS